MAAAATCAQRIRFAKWLFQGLGACVGLLFALQGVIIFVGPAWGQQDRPLDDFWKACHWASEGALCVLVGLGSFLMEVRACSPRVSTHLLQFAVNRLGLAVVYAWLGCYSVGGRIQQGGVGWQTLGRVTGVAAWAVSVAHVCLACCTEEAQGGGAAAAPAAAGKGPGHGGAAADAGGDAPPGPPTVVYASPASYGAPPPPVAQGGLSAAAAGSVDLEGQPEAPEPGWAAVPDKPFGAS